MRRAECCQPYRLTCARCSRDRGWGLTPGSGAPLRCQLGQRLVRARGLRAGGPRACRADGADQRSHAIEARADLNRRTCEAQSSLSCFFKRYGITRFGLKPHQQKSPASPGAAGRSLLGGDVAPPVADGTETSRRGVPSATKAPDTYSMSRQSYRMISSGRLLVKPQRIPPQ